MLQMSQLNACSPHSLTPSRSLTHSLTHSLTAHSLSHTHSLSLSLSLCRSLAAVELAIDAAGQVEATHPMRLPCAVASAVCSAMGVDPRVGRERLPSPGQTSNQCLRDRNNDDDDVYNDRDEDEEEDDGVRDLVRAAGISNVAFGGGWELFESRWKPVLGILPGELVGEAEEEWQHLSL